MLEPDYAAVNATVIAVRSYISSDLLEQQTLVLLLALLSDGCGELMGEKFLLAVFPALKNMSVGFGLESEVGVVSVDDAEAAEEEVDFHDPVRVVAEVFADAVG